MGLGDEIMALGEAQALARRTGLQVLILDRKGQPRSHPLWLGDPDVIQPGLRMPALYQRLENGPGLRPYIARVTEDKFDFVPYAPKRARLIFTPEQVAIGERYRDRIIVEPNVKGTSSANKDWGFAKWQALVDLRPDWPWLQLSAPDKPDLRGVEALHADLMTHAAILRTGFAAVLPEGGLHHAAAAAGAKRCVVLFGHFVAPENTGYPDLQINVADPDAPCGQRRPCAQCQAFWDRLMPEQIINILEAIQ